MRKIIVTGATSFIAIPLIQRLLDNGDYVYAVIRPKSVNMYKLPKHKNIEIIELELSNITNITHYIYTEIDIIYHFAWEGVRGEARNNSALQKKNYQATIMLLKISQQFKIKKFIGAGSQAEYGYVDGPISENISENPDTEYGKYKLKAYQECRRYVENANVNTSLLWPRIFSVYGEDDFHNSLIMTCIDKMTKNEIVLLTECKQKWNYIYKDDVVNALFLLSIVDCENGVYNIAGEDTRMLSDFINELKIILKSNSELQYGAIPYGTQGIINIEPNILKIKSAIHWREETTFQNGIRKIIQWKTYVDEN